MNIEIANDLGIDEDTVAKWRSRFAKQPNLKTLKDLTGRGRKPKISPVVKDEVIKIACSPLKQEYKLRGETRWTIDLIQEEIKTPISRFTIWSILNNAHIKPHKFKMWQHSPDPDFKKKFKK